MQKPCEPGQAPELHRSDGPCESAVSVQQLFDVGSPCHHQIGEAVRCDGDPERLALDVQTCQHEPEQTSPDGIEVADTK